MPVLSVRWSKASPAAWRQRLAQSGARRPCLPWFRWLHRFGRPTGVPYPLTIEDKLRNYLIGHTELGMDLRPILRHFVAFLPKERIVAITAETLWDGTEVLTAR